MFVTFAFVTMHLVVDLLRVYVAFTSRMDTPQYPTAYYAQVSATPDMIKNTAYIVTTLVADALLIYRTWIVWGRSWYIAIFPILLFGVDLGISVWFDWSMKQAEPGKSVTVSAAFDRSKYFYIATLVLNWFCTVMISWKLWRIRRGVVGKIKVAGMRSGSSSAISIIFESAGIYTAALIFLLGTAAVESAALFIFLNSMPPLIGSVFSFIILRSTTDVRRFNTTTAGNLTSIGTASNRSREITTFGHMSNRRDPQETITMDDGVHIHLDRVVHMDETRTNIGIDPKDDDFQDHDNSDHTRSQKGENIV